MFFQLANQVVAQAESSAALVPWVVFFPAAGILLNLLFGKWLGQKGPGILASLASAAAFLVAVLLALRLSGAPEPISVPLLEWMVLSPLVVSWALRIDTLSVTMMLVVAGVGALIHIYAIGYMRHDVNHNGDPGRYRRFFVYFNLFIVMMMILVSADNYLTLFVGWEGVGLCSYLLIGFWFEKGRDGIANAQAAKKAFIVNRIGDFGLLIALFLLYWNFGSFDFDVVFEQAAAVAAASSAVITVITLFMLLGVTGKSAQIPLFTWLPDAMAGPTPVSALIHAATMVTAGVYLVARSYPLFEAAPAAQMTVAWVGAATALFAATIAIGQFDIKRVLAYSTISQLGFMIAAVGMGAYVAAMFHLITHAFFKALLFLSAGSVILGMERGQEAAYGHTGGPGHAVPDVQTEAAAQGGAAHGEFDPQDMRHMGGLRARMPVTFWVYLVGVLSIAGIAPFSGFFSKDEILAAALPNHSALFVILAVTALLTAFYMGRQFFMVFSGPARTRAAGAAGENRPLITVPLIILAVLSAVGGALNLPGIYTLEHWLEHTIEAIQVVPFSILLATIALLISIAGLALAWALYARRPAVRPQSADPLPALLRPQFLFRALQRGWWVDEIYDAVFVRSYQAIARFLAGPVDQGFIDELVNGFGYLMQSASQVVRRLQTGFVRSYGLVFLIGVVAIMSYLIFWQMR